MNQMFTTEQRDEYYGLYWEEVGKIVDGLEVDVKTQTITTQVQCDHEMSERVGTSEWATDNKQWAIHTLLWSQNACAAIDEHAGPLSQRYFVAGDFPFTEFANRAMLLDVADKLSLTGWYMSLSLSYEDADAADEDEDDEDDADYDDEDEEDWHDLIEEDDEVLDDEDDNEDEDEDDDDEDDDEDDE